MPRVFISYSQRGTPEKWVYELASFLRSNGIEAEYDQSLRGKGRTINFDEMMVKGITESDFVILVLSDDYATRVNDPVTGVGVEFNLVRSDLLRLKLDRYVFCLHSGAFDSALPTVAKQVDTHDLRSVDFNSPGQVLEDLLRHLLGIERIDMKPIGARPSLLPRKP